MEEEFKSFPENKLLDESESENINTSNPNMSKTMKSYQFSTKQSGPKEKEADDEQADPLCFVIEDSLVVNDNQIEAEKPDQTVVIVDLNDKHVSPGNLLCNEKSDIQDQPDESFENSEKESLKDYFEDNSVVGEVKQKRKSDQLGALKKGEERSKAREPELEYSKTKDSERGKGKEKEIGVVLSKMSKINNKTESFMEKGSKAEEGSDPTECKEGVIKKKPFICRFFVKGLCKYAEKCEYLHEKKSLSLHQQMKETECPYFSFGMCSTSCSFRHTFEEADQCPEILPVWFIEFFMKKKIERVFEDAESNYLVEETLELRKKVLNQEDCVFVGVNLQSFKLPLSTKPQINSKSPNTNFVSLGNYQNNFNPLTSNSGNTNSQRNQGQSFNSHNLASNIKSNLTKTSPDPNALIQNTQSNIDEIDKDPLNSQQALLQQNQLSSLQSQNANSNSQIQAIGSLQSNMNTSFNTKHEVIVTLLENQKSKFFVISQENFVVNYYFRYSVVFLKNPQKFQDLLSAETKVILLLFNSTQHYFLGFVELIGSGRIFQINDLDCLDIVFPPGYSCFMQIVWLWEWRTVNQKVNYLLSNNMQLNLLASEQEIDSLLGIRLCKFMMKRLTKDETVEMFKQYLSETPLEVQTFEFVSELRKSNLKGEIAGEGTISEVLKNADGADACCIKVMETKEGKNEKNDFGILTDSNFSLQVDENVQIKEGLNTNIINNSQENNLQSINNGPFQSADNSLFKEPRNSQTRTESETIPKSITLILSETGLKLLKDKMLDALIQIPDDFMTKSDPTKYQLQRSSNSNLRSFTPLKSEYLENQDLQLKEKEISTTINSKTNDGEISNIKVISKKKELLGIKGFKTDKKSQVEKNDCSEHKENIPKNELLHKTIEYSTIENGFYQEKSTSEKPISFSLVDHLNLGGNNNSIFQEQRFDSSLNEDKTNMTLNEEKFELRDNNMENIKFSPSTTKNLYLSQKNLASNVLPINFPEDKGLISLISPSTQENINFAKSSNQQHEYITPNFLFPVHDAKRPNNHKKINLSRLRESSSYRFDEEVSATKNKNKLIESSNNIYINTNININNNSSFNYNHKVISPYKKLDLTEKQKDIRSNRRRSPSIYRERSYNKKEVKTKTEKIAKQDKKGRSRSNHNDFESRSSRKRSKKHKQTLDKVTNHRYKKRKSSDSKSLSDSSRSKRSYRKNHTRNSHKHKNSSKSKDKVEKRERSRYRKRSKNRSRSKARKEHRDKINYKINTKEDKDKQNETKEYEEEENTHKGKTPQVISKIHKETGKELGSIVIGSSEIKMQENNSEAFDRNNIKNNFSLNDKDIRSENNKSESNNKCENNTIKDNRFSGQPFLGANSNNYPSNFSGNRQFYNDNFGTDQEKTKSYSRNYRNNYGNNFGNSQYQKPKDFYKPYYHNNQRNIHPQGQNYHQTNRTEHPNSHLRNKRKISLSYSREGQSFPQFQQLDESLSQTQVLSQSNQTTVLVSSKLFSKALSKAYTNYRK